MATKSSRNNSRCGLVNKKIFAYFLVVAAVALALHFFLFELRYAWYLNDDDFSFIRIGYGVFLLTVVVAWCFYPSRVLVSVIGAAAFAFPPLLRGGVFASITLGMVPFVLLSILLLLGATELRRRAFQQRIGSGS
jgi:hypothetical protein